MKPKRHCIARTTRQKKYFGRRERKERKEVIEKNGEKREREETPLLKNVQIGSARRLSSKVWPDWTRVEMADLCILFVTPRFA